MINKVFKKLLKSQLVLKIVFLLKKKTIDWMCKTIDWIFNDRCLYKNILKKFLSKSFVISKERKAPIPPCDQYHFEIHTSRTEYNLILELW